MMRLSEAARVLGGELLGKDGEFDAVRSDTRALPLRALFVALRGERFDGHDFLDQAAAAGAAGALVQEAEGRGPRVEGKGTADGLPLIVVSDTRLALGALAAHWRSRFDIPLVAVTGSNGKTTVKEMLAAILREVHDEPRDVLLNTPSRGTGHESRVLSTRGNLNNDIGLPLTLLELDSAHRCAVIEMGMNHAGEIRYLASLARPDVALVTNAGMAHRAFFDSEEAIARAKGEIFESLTGRGTAVINADDRNAPLWRGLAAGQHIVEFGLEHEAAVTARYTLRFLESEIVVKTPAGEATAVVRAPGVHNVRNALAASAAAHALAVPPREIAAGLSRFAGVKGRLQRKPGAGGATLIDDTYNANPDSARAAISVLALAAGMKLFVLGDMGELGAGAGELHAGIGEAARAAGVDRLYTLGDLAREAARSFGEGAQEYADVDALVAAVKADLSPQSTVLVKGSRFMRMERVVDALCDDRVEGRGSGEQKR